MSTNYRKPHVFDPISDGSDECECGLVKDSDLHLSDVVSDRRVPFEVNTMTTEKDKATPERVWLLSGPLPFNPNIALYAYQGDAPEPDAIAYIREDVVATRVKDALERTCLAMCVKCRLVEQFTPAERVGDGKRWFHRATNTSFEDGIASQCDAWPIRNLGEE